MELKDIISAKGRPNITWRKVGQNSCWTRRRKRPKFYKKSISTFNWKIEPIFYNRNSTKSPKDDLIACLLNDINWKIFDHSILKEENHSVKIEKSDLTLDFTRFLSVKTTRRSFSFEIKIKYLSPNKSYWKNFNKNQSDRKPILINLRVFHLRMIVPLESSWESFLLPLIVKLLKRFKPANKTLRITDVAKRKGLHCHLPSSPTYCQISKM